MATRKITFQQGSRHVEQVRSLLDAQRVGVLATHHGGQPYSSLVAIAASTDLKSVAFATRRRTRKFENLTADPRVSLMVDDRTNDISDLHRVTAITVLGRVEELSKTSPGRLMKRYLKRHPYMEDFVASRDCALLRIKVEKYVVVTRFEHVVELVVGVRDVAGPPETTP